MNQLGLSITPDTTNGLCLTRIVNLLSRGQERTEEDGMIRPRQVCAAGAFVCNVEQQNAFDGVVLELLQVLRLLRRAAFDLKILNAVGSKCLSDFLHEIRELDKDEDPLLLWNAISC